MKQCIFLMLSLLLLFNFASQAVAQGVYVTFDKVSVVDMWEENQYIFGATLKLEYSGFPMKAPDQVKKWVDGAGPYDANDYNYTYVNSYKGYVYVDVYGLMDETHTFKFQIVLNSLNSNQKSIVLSYE